MNRIVWIVMLAIGLAARGAGAADTLVGQWKTVDEKSGAVQSVVEIYDQGGKLFGKIVSLTKPTDPSGIALFAKAPAGKHPFTVSHASYE